LYISDRIIVTGYGLNRESRHVIVTSVMPAIHVHHVQTTEIYSLRRSFKTKEECMKAKINELETKCNKKNVKDELTGEWRRLRNEELNDLLFSPNIIRVIKSSRMKWAEHVARSWEKRGAYRILVGRPAGKSHLEDPCVNGSIILK
jgi:hypothetical protein